MSFISISLILHCVIYYGDYYFMCVCVTVFYYFLLQVIPVQTYIAERNPGNKEALIKQKMEISILVTLVVVFTVYTYLLLSWTLFCSDVKKIF